jgi:hypothetical protein
MVGQSSDVIIDLYNPNPGSYPIKVHGIGADGKTRDAMTVIAVSSKIGTRSYVPSGYFMNYIPVHLGKDVTQLNLTSPSFRHTDEVHEVHPVF